MPTTRTLPRGASIAPMPAQIHGSDGPKLQGGLPPVANRTPWARAADTGKSARTGWNCKRISMECLPDTKPTPQHRVGADRAARAVILSSFRHSV